MARNSLFPPSVKPGKPILTPCPPGWMTVTFGDVLDVLERPIDLIDNVEYQLVTAKRSRGGVVARSRLLGRDVLTKTQFQIARDDFLMSNRQIIHGGCGIVPPALDGAVVSNEYSVLRPNSKLILEFLGYLSHSIYFQQTCFHASVGVDVEKMIFDCERWLGFNFHLPPLHEQRRIAEILSSVDEAIAATRSVIEQTRKVKQGVLERLLTKGIGHTRFKQTEIGEIPEGWQLTTLEELLADIPNPMRSGPFGSALKSEELVDSGVPFLGIDNIQVEQFIRNYKRFLSEDKFRELRRFAVNPNDVVITIMGTVGRCCVIPPDIGEAVSSKHIWALSLHHQRYIPELACWQVNFAPWIVSKFTTSAQGGIMSAINSGILRKLVFPVPGLDEQRQILQIWQSFQSELQVEQAKLQNLEALKSSLMSELLTGLKRVTDTMPMAAE